MSDELARSEAFMREVHEMYPAGQLDAYVAEYERMRKIEAAVRAWMVTPGRKVTAADIGAAHRRLQDALRVPPP